MLMMQLSFRFVAFPSTMSLLTSACTCSARSLIPVPVCYFLVILRMVLPWILAVFYRCTNDGAAAAGLGQWDDCCRWTAVMLAGRNGRWQRGSG